MHWAINSFGKVVSADEGGYISGLRCPVCSEPVRRRAGAERKPHFAHYSFRAKPDCENYFPSIGSGALASRAFSQLASRPWKQTQSLQFGVFLAKRDTTNSWTLFFRLPQFGSAKELSGTLIFHTSLGKKQIFSEQLSRHQLITLEPRIPLLRVTATEGLSWIAQVVEEKISSFATTPAVFKESDLGSRLLDKGEPLTWGTRYLVMVSAPFTISDSVNDQISLSHVGRLSNWLIYRISLPLECKLLSDSEKAAISKAFQRSFSTPTPRLAIGDPWPSKFGPDGTAFYSNYPRELLVRSSGPGEVTVLGGSGCDSYVTVEPLGGYWYKVKALDLVRDDVTISVAGVEGIVLSRCAPELRHPNGITVKCSDRVFDLTCTQESELLTGNIESIAFDCISERLAARMHELNPQSLMSGTKLMVRPDSNLLFDGAGFGMLRSGMARTNPKDYDCTPISTLDPSGVKWISALYRQQFQSSISIESLRELGAASAEGRPIGPIATSKLYPYIRILTKKFSIE